MINKITETPVPCYSVPISTLPDGFAVYLRSELEKHHQSVANLERLLGVSPTTAEIRQAYKKAKAKA
jgi:hypothetical protein